MLEKEKRKNQDLVNRINQLKQEKVRNCAEMYEVHDSGGGGGGK